MRGYRASLCKCKQKQSTKIFLSYRSANDNVGHQRTLSSDPHMIWHTSITQENHHPHSLENRVGLCVMRAGIWAVLDYCKNNAAFYLCSALLLLSSWFSRILLWILLIHYVQSHLSCTDHYWHSFSHSPSMGLPKINLVSEAEILGIHGSGHAMPLVTGGINFRVLKFSHCRLRMSHLMAPRPLIPGWSDSSCWQDACPASPTCPPFPISMSEEIPPSWRERRGQKEVKCS